VFLPKIDANGKMGYQLLWKVIFHRDGEPATWTAHVDAQTGELVEFWNSNDYGQAEAGAYPAGPVNSTETLLPTPFADVTGGYTDSCGKYTQTGTVTSALNGKYVKMSDSCGSISLSSSTGTLNFGTSTGTDCTTPGVGGAGNTHASRTGFYHVNRTKE